MDRPYRIKAVLFDFDGTLTRPGAIDFSIIRQRIGCPADVAILEFIRSLSSDSLREEATAEVCTREMAAAGETIPNTGAERILVDLKALGAKVGIISRNNRMSIERALLNFEHTGIETFDLVISRDDPFLPKPDPEGILHAAEFFRVPVKEILVVGDFVFDIDAANRAGSMSAFITNGEEAEVLEKTDFTIQSLEELLPIVQMGLPLQCGKLPQELLDNFLKELEYNDPSVLNWPGVGEDTTAVAVKEEELIVITSDPITFATDALGEYTVLVNANDIATSGGTPRWFLTTLLFPVNTTASEIRFIMADLAAVCKRCDITLCGGHTEITDAVSRTVINGMMVGSVDRDKFLDKKDMRPGDQILMTKGAGIEGTALIAREFGGQLADMGVSRCTIQRAKAFISRISVLEEAKIAAGIEGVKALHDITEGGLATALEEFSIAGGSGIEVQVPQIPVLAETKAVCLPFNIDPLGLIGSGSLLICCAPDVSEQLQDELESAGIDRAVIGTVVSGEPGIVPMDGSTIVPWPCFAVDEITRLFR